MIWSNDISFDGYKKKQDEWYGNNPGELCDCPIDAQFALDLIFKTLIDDKEKLPYLTTMSESTEQTNDIMLHMILEKYSKEYRRYLKYEQKRSRDSKV